MNNKLFQSSKIRHKINQYINTLFRSRYWQKKIIFNIFLSVTCGLIVTFIGMKMDLGNTAEY